jgi:hypothetical protein
MVGEEEDVKMEEPAVEDSENIPDKAESTLREGEKFVGIRETAETQQ